MKETLVRFFQERASSLGNSSDLEQAVIVGESDIEIEWRDPDSNDHNWNYNHYGGECVFFRDSQGDTYANPVKIELDEEKDYNLKPSQEYQNVMNNELIAQAQKSAELDEFMDEIMMFQKYTLGAIGLLAGIVAWGAI